MPDGGSSGIIEAIIQLFLLGGVTLAQAAIINIVAIVIAVLLVLLGATIAFWTITAKRKKTGRKVVPFNILGIVFTCFFVIAGTAAGVTVGCGVSYYNANTIHYVAKQFIEDYYDESGFTVDGKDYVNLAGSVYFNPDAGKVFNIPTYSAKVLSNSSEDNNSYYNINLYAAKIEDCKFDILVRKDFGIFNSTIYQSERLYVEYSYFVNIDQEDEVINYYNKISQDSRLEIPNYICKDKSYFLNHGNEFTVKYYRDTLKQSMVSVGRGSDYSVIQIAYYSPDRLVRQSTAYFIKNGLQWHILYSENADEGYEVTTGAAEALDTLVQRSSR